MHGGWSTWTNGDATWKTRPTSRPRLTEPYDVAHEYDHDWTLDPDYSDEGFHFSEFEEDGVPIASDA